MASLIALVSALTTAIYFVYTSRIMKREYGISSSLTLSVGHLVAAIALFPVWIMRSSPNIDTLFSPTMDVLLLSTAGLLVISRELYFYAYARTDVANITVFSALTPIYALVIGIIFLGEIPKPLTLAGMLLITGSIYALFLKRDPALSLGKNIAQPFARISSSRPILCAFLSTIPTAFAATFQKKLMSTLDPATFSLFLLLIIGTFALVISMILESPRELLAQSKRFPVGYILASAVMLPLMHILFCLVLREQQTAVSLILQRSSIMFQIVLAYLFLHERQDMKKRITVAACIVAGFLMIMAK